jgi:hypothetical protein
MAGQKTSELIHRTIAEMGIHSVSDVITVASGAVSKCSSPRIPTTLIDRQTWNGAQE